MNLTAAWVDFADDFDFDAAAEPEECRKYTKEVFYAGAAAMWIVMRNIQKIHSDNSEAMVILLQGVGNEFKAAFEGMIR